MIKDIASYKIDRQALGVMALLGLHTTEKIINYKPSYSELTSIAGVGPATAQKVINEIERVQEEIHEQANN